MAIKKGVIGLILISTLLFFSCTTEKLKDPQAEWDRLVELDRSDQEYYVAYAPQSENAKGTLISDIQSYKHYRYGKKTSTIISMEGDYSAGIIGVYTEGNKFTSCIETDFGSDVECQDGSREELESDIQPLISLINIIPYHELYEFESYVGDKTVAGRECRDFTVRPKPGSALAKFADDTTEIQDVIFKLCLDKEQGVIVEYKIIENKDKASGAPAEGIYIGYILTEYSQTVDPGRVEAPRDGETGDTLTERCIFSTGLICEDYLIRLVPGKNNHVLITIGLVNSLGNEIQLKEVSFKEKDGSTECKGYYRHYPDPVNDETKGIFGAGSTIVVEFYQNEEDGCIFGRESAPLEHGNFIRGELTFKYTDINSGFDHIMKGELAAKIK